MLIYADQMKLDILFKVLSFILHPPHCLKSETNPGSPSPETNKGVQPALVYKAPPDMKRSRREGRLLEKNSGKENLFTSIKGADPYEAYARTDRTHGQQQLLRRPEWNTQRPGKAFVPASERYPASLQRHRQENRMRRQMELMTLVERNTRTPQQAMPQRSGNPSRVQRHSNSAHEKVSKLSTSMQMSVVVIMYGKVFSFKSLLCFRMRIRIECSLPVKSKQ